jgi:coenzyme Q-binding protein COQ10
MPQFSTKRRVKHSASDMFDLVADVGHYPEFVPLCSALKVRSHTGAGQEKGKDRGKDKEILIVDMTVAYKLISETFSSRVTLDKPGLMIHVEYLDGPFKRMDNLWSFRPTGERACEVTFDIDYEFNNRMLAMLMGAMFDAAFRKFSAAFEKRADEIYGVTRTS